MTKDYKLALIDLGHTERHNASVQKWTGTPQYRPQEVGPRTPYRLAYADMYSLAVTLLVIMIQDLPFAKVARGDFDQMYDWLGNKHYFYSKIYSSFRDFDQRHPKEVLDLLYRCLNPNPQGRPSIVEFESCEWIAQAPEDIDEDLRKELKALYDLHKHPEDN